jgi:hypothetical protein
MATPLHVLKFRETFHRQRCRGVILHDNVVPPRIGWNLVGVGRSAHPRMSGRPPVHPRIVRCDGVGRRRHSRAAERPGETASTVSARNADGQPQGCAGVHLLNGEERGRASAFDSSMNPTVGRLAVDYGSTAVALVCYIGEVGIVDCVEVTSVSRVVDRIAYGPARPSGLTPPFAQGRGGFRRGFP